jgi:hypothetical protein
MYKLIINEDKYSITHFFCDMNTYFYNNRNDSYL